MIKKLLVQLNRAAGWKKGGGLFIFAVLLGAMAHPSFAENADAAKAVKPRPRIGLVLSGGGARGAAHIGVLKVLEELRVPVDYIAGTSMGSIVGGSYASGNSIDQMLRDISTIKSADLATDAPPRRDVSVRRKQDDLLNYIGPEMGFRGGSLLLPKGVVTGVGLEAVLRDLAKVKGSVDFDKLPIPFRAVATDIETGKMTVFRSGDLAAVMRASMSVPGAIAPAEVDGRALVDGGLTRNLPVDVARDMGADIVIAVNLGTPLMPRDQISSLLGVTGQMINILTEQNVQASLASLKPDDILILPELGDYSSTDFDHMPDTVPIGEAAARKVRDRLARYSLSPEQYAEHRRRQKGVEAAAPKVIDEIRVEGLKRVNPAVIEETMETQTGKPLDTKVLDADMRRLYGRGDFEHVGYRLIEEPGKRILVVDAVEKSWGPNYVRLGLGLSSESGGDSYFNVLASHRMTWLNSLGAEWKNDVQMGQATRLASEFYQPLSVNRYLFVAPTVEYDQYYLQIFHGGIPLAKYNIRSTTAGLDLGSQITKYGELRVGLVYGPRTFTLNTGPAELAPADGQADIGAVRARLRIDQLDSVKFPRSGYAAFADILDSQTGLGARDDYTRWEASVVSAVSFGDNTVQVALKGGGAVGSSKLPVYDQFSFGGFLQLSGYQTGQFYGESLTFGRLMYYRKLTKAVLTEGVYAGASLEAGRIGGQLVSGNPTGVLEAGSLFLAADTPLGPVYLAYGIAQDSNRTVYFFLGLPYF
ncbi:MAG TPA: patatin-like phospholipase family protein [Nitrospirota bacterium]|nr:patatin-like phospholipase family protein [Nitrospirota bacterium]